MPRGTGLGKLILCGEHAVVYGHPALAFAVDRRTEVTLTPGDGEVDAPGVDDPRLREALTTLLPAGVSVRIRSDIPIGRGMGSSAALAVATVRARGALEGTDPTPDDLFEEALRAERIFHGQPSGLDVAVSARGGFLAYRRGPPPRIDRVPGTAGWGVVVLDTGRAGNTADLVARVAAGRPGVDGTLNRIGSLVERARNLLQDPRALGELLSENQRLLQSIGVSAPDIEALVALALEAGAYGAKLSGAGGGGVVLAIVDDPGPVLAAARAAGVSAFSTQVGGVS